MEKADDAELRVIPHTFRRLTGVSVGVFFEMAVKIGPLWKKAE
ncbi:hypothetical protein [Desulfonema ishimotonii]|nr:hypothetical protein [Desulfonema ishimotonii]